MKNEGKWALLMALICTILVSIVMGKLLYIAVNANNAVTPEEDFTPVQKAFIKSFTDAAAELRKAQADLNKSKLEFVQIINDAHAMVIAKNIDTNVHTTYIVYGPNDRYAVRTGTNVPVAFGFRSDRLVTWKYADE